MSTVGYIEQHEILFSPFYSPLAKCLNAVLFQGTDQPASNIADRMEGRSWGVTGVGWGIRNSTLVELVERFEGIVMIFQMIEFYDD